MDQTHRLHLPSRIRRHYQQQNIDRPLPATFNDYREMLDKMQDRSELNPYVRREHRVGWQP
jgi:hypothetical protein